MLATEEQTAQLVGFFRTHGVLASHRKNEYIIEPGATPPGVFYVVDGLVKAYDVTRYGEENLLIIRKSHEIFPLIWALTGQERHIIYRSLKPTTSLRVDREVFMNFLRHSPDTLAPLLDITIEMYRLHSERIINLEYRTVRERVISFLLTTSERFGTVHPNGVKIGVQLRHQDIASSVNSSRETTTRELAYLERKGLIGKDGPYFIIRNSEQLEAHLSRPLLTKPISNSA
ncbi:MAG TPA: Crp/Fnr family transcriptional regulator [Verrucomicrobiae bacterium]|nr:Crp/Fnr family transcriptional regulator [Verrucomicrobiae bacterium]